MNATQEFSEAIQAAGITAPDDIIGDGKLHRFSSNGHPKDDAGWYVFHDDESPAGVFGCNRSSLEVKWKSGKSAEFTPEQRAAIIAITRCTLPLRPRRWPVPARR